MWNRILCERAGIPRQSLSGAAFLVRALALFDPLQRFLDKVEWRPGGSRVKLLPAKLGEFAGAYGSAANALEKWS